MAKAITEKFEELVLDVAFDPAAPTVFTTICGMVDVTVNRAAAVDEAEIPDCDDESLPLSVEVQVRSITVTVSATGVWAQTSHGKLQDWFYSSAPLEARVRNTGAAIGDTEIESGPALLTTLNNARTKGQKVTAEIEIRFDGTPVRTAKAA
jgi:hypothetical protein